MTTENEIVIAIQTLKKLMLETDDIKAIELCHRTIDYLKILLN